MKTMVQTDLATQTVLGQPSWRMTSKDIEAFVTERGGHLGPVTFQCGSAKIQPFSIAPWAEEKVEASQPSILKVLRGDFFCMPFGANAKPFLGEEHPVHGETANAKWTFESLATKGKRTCLHLSLRTKRRRGRVDKKVYLIDGHPVLYCRHEVSNMAGPMTIGHHAMLKFPDEECSGNIATSPFVFGQVFPEVFEKPEKGGYSALNPGADFTSLEQVPLHGGGVTDLTKYPTRSGFEDLVMLVSDAAVPFAWTAVTFPKQRYVWFAFKNQRILRHTILWISNGGRHYSPWNGRHVSVMGLEDVTAYFHYGLAESARKNPITEKGFPTCVTLDPTTPLAVPYIMGVVPIPQGFDRVAAVEETDEKVTFRSASGKTVSFTVALDFLHPNTVW